MRRKVRSARAGVLGLPFSSTVILAVLGAVAAMGAAGYGGYTVYKDGSNGYAGDFETRRHRVVRVIDGDTFTVEKDPRAESLEPRSEKSGRLNMPRAASAKEEIKIRMIGINAPELTECGGVEAKDALERKLAGVEIELRKNLDAVDDHERLLRYVVVADNDPTADVRLVSRELLRDGFVYLQDEPDNDMYRDAHRIAENAAEEAGRGVWGECTKEIAQMRADVLYEKSGLREEDNAPHKKGCDIKGNVSEKGYGKIYFMPSCPNYKNIKVDSRKGEAYFCTEAEAKEEGFVKSESCENTF